MNAVKGSCLAGLGWLGIALGLLGAPGPQLPAAPSASQAEGVEFFENKVRPILVDNCFKCHGNGKHKGNFRLDSRAGLLTGGDQGPAIVPGDPDKSLLIQAIQHQGGKLMMPPSMKLPQAQIADLTQWVKMGAPWPGADKTTPKVKRDAKPITDQDRAHWAFQPVKQPAAPAVKYGSWVQSPVDAFILAKLESQKMVPAPPADKRTLIRRASYDLIGLPPTPEQVAAFLADNSPNAFAKVVDRLLASPHYGERWGRHWLDVARYADTKGDTQGNPIFPNAFTYRDYVIRAFNEDLPHDRFLLEQIAADQLELGADKKPLAALGFITVGRRFLNDANDTIADRIDVVTQGAMALTVSCARCHDHKFDPIPTRDYYSLHGVFASSTEPEQPPLLGVTPDAKEYADYLAKRKRLDDQLQELGNAPVKQAFVRKLQLTKEKGKLEASHPGSPPRAMVLLDSPNPKNSRVFLRGNPNNLGEDAPRQFLAILTGEMRKPFTKGSGRLELAQAIANRDNPLTARVMVNRVWLHHFGAGLVTTPNDFGLRSDPPSHPELLNYLAWRFMEDGWSLKKLHRLLMLSSVYQQQSDDKLRNEKLDPDNRLLAKMNRRRLDFESMRDTLLLVAGNLDRSLGGRPVDLIKQPTVARRTVYGFIDRQNLPGLLRMFDFADPDTTNAQRFDTTVPQQALFFLNSAFVMEQAAKMLERPEFKKLEVGGARIRRLYQLIYQRDPSVEEVKLGLRFIEARSKNAAPDPNDSTKGKRLTPWKRYAQVLLMSNELMFVD